MELRPLDPRDFDELHRTFVRAFSDYDVPLDVPPDRLRAMMERRGAALDLSVGAFDEGAMVGLMVVALDDHEGRHTAYDVFTGIVPSHRGRGLAGALFDQARPVLRERGAERFLLEVIRSNEAALRAYRRVGFVRTRGFLCFEVGSEGGGGGEDRVGGAGGTGAGIVVVPSSLAEMEDHRSWGEVRPSWQNAEASLRRAAGWLRVWGARVGDRWAGFAAVDPLARDLPRLFVDPARRRRGVGSALLRRAVEDLGGEALRVINVDEAADGALAFLRAHGRASLPAQSEMQLSEV